MFFFFFCPESLTSTCSCRDFHCLSIDVVFSCIYSFPKNLCATKIDSFGIETVSQPVTDYKYLRHY